MVSNIKIKSSKKLPRYKRTNGPAKNKSCKPVYRPAGLDYCMKKAITARKVVFVFIATCMLMTALLVAANSQAHGFQNEPEGWYGVAWGTTFDNMPDEIKNNVTLEVEDEAHKLKMYEARMGTVDAPDGATSIAFSFIENKFMSIVIKLIDEEASASFIKKATSVFGKYSGIDQDAPGIVTIFWIGDETIITIASSGTSEYNVVLIGSTSGLLAFGLSDPDIKKEHNGPETKKEGKDLRI